MPDEDVTERPMLTDDYALNGFAVSIYAAVHDMETPEAYAELMGRPHRHSTYIKAARGALRYCQMLTDYRLDER
jgi:hypothetical protein